MERWGLYLLLLCCLIWAVTGVGVFALVHRALKSPRRLTKAIGSIGEDNLDERVPVESQDRIGEFVTASNRMTEQAEVQVEDLQLLLGALAHEIKVPTTAVIGYSGSLLHIKLPGEQKERAPEQIHHAGLRLERLSSKMLNLPGTYENGKIQMEEIVIEEFFQEVFKGTEPLWREKQLAMIEKVGEEKASEVLTVRGDRGLLIALLYNLVHNAVKASRPGERIWLTAEDGMMVVRDEGLGIPEKDLSHVTKAFYMTDKSRSRSEGGSGLGLVLCERIALLHGFRMEIRNP